MVTNNGNTCAASSRGLYANTGVGSALQPIDIGHDEYIGLISPDAAFWSLVKKEDLGAVLTEKSFYTKYRKAEAAFTDEMNTLRFNLKTSAVYFNPTDRCNLNCDYCYIPEKIRKNGKHMPTKKLLEALGILKKFFKKNLPKGQTPQIVFHGAEPLMNKEAVFAGITKFKKDFLFGVQTNGTMLDDEAISFLRKNNVSIGLSLDGVTEKIADSARKTWDGQGVSKQVVAAMEKLKGYKNYSVICTASTKNMQHLTKVVDFFHKMEVENCLLNPIRCTLEGARKIKPDDNKLAKHFFKAMDRTHELYKKTGRKLVVANFANILVSIVAPSARRLMCDISPCGGGRCFFAVSANGDMFPCSEFIGVKKFKGGNLFKDEINKALDSKPFKMVTGRKVEDIDPCSRCAVRHFCGSPCPAEAYEMNGGMEKPGAFCEFYEEQVRYALRLIADQKTDDFLWDNWDSDTKTVFNLTSI